jgi:hypothetical protein
VLGPDLDALIQALVPFAQQMLRTRGEYYPFGATVDLQGKVAAASAHPSGAHPESQEVIDLLTDGFRSLALTGEISAAGICFDVRTPLPGTSKKTDAICVSLAGMNGDAADVYIPYSKTMLGRLKYGTAYVSHGTLDVFQRGEESGYALADKARGRWNVVSGELFGASVVARVLQMDAPRTEYPVRLGFAAKHRLALGESNDPAEYERLRRIEDTLVESLSGRECLLAAILTSPSAREFIYYVESATEATRCVDVARQRQSELQFYIEADESWDLYRMLRSGDLAQPL